MKLKIEPVKQEGIAKLGFGKYTLKSSGCYLSCLYSTLKFFGKNYPTLRAFNDAVKRLKGFKAGTSLIDGEAFAKAFNYTFQWVSSGDFEKIIKGRLDKGFPTIIRISNFMHFVLAIGYDKDILINDPIAGETYWLKAKKWGIKSLRLYTPNQLPNSDLAECLKAHTFLMSQLEKQGKELVEQGKKLITSENICKNLRKMEKSLNQKIGKLDKEGGLCQVELNNRQEDLERVEGEKEVVEAQRSQYKSWYEKKLGESITKATVRELLKEIFARIVGKNG